MSLSIIIPDEVHELMNSGNATLPQTYQNAILALSECNKVDECKQWKDKAAAVASYAKQTNDETMMKLAKRIQVRAYRRMGQLLKQFDGRGGDGSNQYNKGAKRMPDQPFSKTQKEVAQNAGISKEQTKTAVNLANIPHDEFEKEVEKGNMPSITELRERGKNKINTGLYDPKPEGFADAINVKGRFRDLAELMEDFNPVYIIGGMDERGIKQMKDYIKVIENWIDNFVINT